MTAYRITLTQTSVETFVWTHTAPSAEAALDAALAEPPDRQFLTKRAARTDVRVTPKGATH